MSFQNDAFSLNFSELYNNYPNRRMNLYRYKVKNYNKTLDKLIVQPSKNVALLLESETNIKAVVNSYQGVKTVVSISSGQNSGAAEGTNSETIVAISGELIPTDYRDELYVYTLSPVIKDQFLIEDIFIDTLGSSTLPEDQIPLYKGAKDEEFKVVNVLTLSKLELKTAASNYKIISYHSDDIDYFNASKPVVLSIPGILGEFNAKYLDVNDHVRETEYELQEDSKHKYAVLQAVPTRIKPTLVLSSDTYDLNKNLKFEIARQFIGKQNSLEVVWKEFGFKIDGDDAAGKLYHAFLTAAFLANQRVTEFKDYRIVDDTSPNLGKINTKTLRDIIYGVSIDDILTIDQSEFTARIFTTWEQEFADDLKDDTNKINGLYQSLKGVLSGLGEFIPSQYAYGNYKKIGRLALEWYFIPKTMNITPDNIKFRNPFNVQLQSLKYDFDDSTKVITGLKQSFRKISSVRTFDLGGQITLPSIPGTFSEENKISTAGTVDITNTSFLNYTWVFQLKDSSKYANLFETENPFIITSEQANQHSIPSSVNITFTDKVGNQDESTTPGLEQYIREHFMLTNRILTPGSGKVIVTSKQVRYQSGSHYEPGGLGGGSSSEHIVYEYKERTEYEYLFEWNEKPTAQINVTPIKPPYSIDQSQWESFETALGSNVSEFILKPIYNEKTKDTRKMTQLNWKATLANYATIKLTAVYKDKSEKELTFTLKQAFARDQTMVQEGVAF